MRTINFLRLKSVLFFSPVLVNFIFIFIFIFFSYESLFHSDSAVKNILAKEIVETGNFFPDGWNYANGDLWIIFGHIFIIPFVYFFDNSFFLHSISGLIVVSIYFYLIYLFLKKANIDNFSKVFIMTYLSSGISFIFAEFLIGQAAYTWSIIFFLFFIFLLDDLLRNRINYKKLSFASISIFFMLLGNPGRIIFFIVVPLGMAIAIIKFIDKDFCQIKKDLSLFALIIFLCFFTIFMHNLIFAFFDINNRNDVSNIQLVESFNQIKNNWHIFIEGLTESLSFFDNSKDKIFTIIGLLKIYYSIIALLIFLTPIYQLVKFKKIECSLNKMLLINYFLILLMVFMVYIFTTSLAKDVLSFRYFVFPIILSILLCSFSLKNFISVKPSTKKIIWLASTPLIFYCYYILIEPFFYCEKDKVVCCFQSKNEHHKIAKFLEEKELYQGYASYWHN